MKFSINKEAAARSGGDLSTILIPKVGRRIRGDPAFARGASALVRPLPVEPWRITWFLNRH